MSLLAHLKSTLNNTFEEFDSSPFTLTEPANITGCLGVTIESKFPDILVYKVDVSKKDVNGNYIEKFPFFNSGDYKSICDYLIFYEKENVLYVLACELKSSTTKGAKNQLYAGLLLSDYFIKTAKRCNDNFEQPIKYKALLFSTRDVYKEMTPDKFFSDVHGTKFGEFLCNCEYSLDSFCH